MTFLVDEDLPRSATSLIRELGFEAVDIRDVGLRGSSDHQIASFALLNRYCLVTADRGFGNVREYPPQDYHGIVVLELPHGSTARTICDLLRGFFAQTEIVNAMVGKAAIVRFGRVRLRS